MKNSQPSNFDSSTPRAGASDSPLAAGTTVSLTQKSADNCGYLRITADNCGNNFFPLADWFLPTQRAWLQDQWRLRLWLKSRQVGATKTDALDTVLKVCFAAALFDAFVTSRDEFQSELYMQDCKEWAKLLNIGARDLGKLLLDRKTNTSARVLRFANGRCIYCLSSNPDALAGKRGHVKIDEFALHSDQRKLYAIAKPVTQWGGTLSIISTHRGPNTVFNQLINDILHHGNPMGWHLYTYTLQQAVTEGLVDRINARSGRSETPEQFLQRTHAECIDEDQWNQEYCCIPTDDTSAFLSHEMITGCEDTALQLLSPEQFQKYATAPAEEEERAFYLGLDFARKQHLCVFDIGEKIGDLMFDRCRIVLQNQPFSVTKSVLYQLLSIPQLVRACIDETGNGEQLAEEAQQEFPWKVEPVHFTPRTKETLAFALLHDFEDRRLRIVSEPQLRADLHAMKKQVSPLGAIRFDGSSDDSHCDRFWAMALRQNAARSTPTIGACLG